MRAGRLHLDILLVEDDRENLELLKQTLPGELRDCALHYDPCDDLEAIPDRLTLRRYDMVITDIYKNRSDGRQMDESDARAEDIVQAIRQHRFCPIVVFTSGSFPTSPTAGPFVKLVKKSKGDDEIIAAIDGFLISGIPQIAKRMHDELDEAAGPRYLWSFLEAHWDELAAHKQNTHEVIERLIRRRASFQFGRLDPDGSGETEVDQVFPADFYLMPPVGKAYRLGSLLHSKGDGSIKVVLTPHCYLEIQRGDKEPRADHVLLVTAKPFADILKSVRGEKKLWKDETGERIMELEDRMQSPAKLGRPNGRYWFLPGFLDIPDLYCDILQVQSVALDTLKNDYDFLAVLDTPYAEALQSCFTSLYSSVGVPKLDPKQFEHLLPKN